MDLLYPGVTEKFLSITLDAYERELGAEFGKRVPGVFTDEPELRPAGGLPWTDDLPAGVREALGLQPARQPAVACSSPVGDWKRVRHNYYQVLLELFVERWGKPYYDYCARHDLEFTGHYWEHDWPELPERPRQHGDVGLAAAARASTCLMNQYAEDTHAQFGNVRAVEGSVERRQPARPRAARSARPTAPAAGTSASRT